MKSQGCNISLLTAIRARGLSQRALSNQIGVHESLVSRWVRDVSITPQRRHRIELERIGLNVYSKDNEKEQ